MGGCLAKPSSVVESPPSPPKKATRAPAVQSVPEDEELDASTPVSESITRVKAKAQKAWKDYERARDHKNSPRRSAIRRAQELDLAFLVDATGSMWGSINMVRKKIVTTVAAIKARLPTSKVRVAFIGYRDYNEKIDRIAFTADVDAFKVAMEAVEVTGGKDVPEDIFSGLEAVAELEWTSAARMIIHIADAPCHGRQFHNSEHKDDYPDGDKLERNLTSILAKLHTNRGIQTYRFYHLSRYTKKMVTEFRKVEGVPEDWIREDTFSNLENIPSQIVSHSQDAIRSSLMRESGRGSSGRRGFAPQEVDTAEPNWDQIVEREAEELAIVPVTAEALVEKIRYGQRLGFESKGTRMLKIAAKPFSADGALRWPFYTLIGPEGEEARVKRVLKRFKTPLDAKEAAMRQSEDSYKEQAEEQFVASVLVARFNELIPGVVRERLEFLHLNLIKVAYGARGLRYHYYTVEDFLDGEYKKFSCNVGEFMPEYTDVLQAFTHWTYEFSGGELMITDLQGIKGLDSMTYYLTDPAIHCRDLDRFSLNWGGDGFAMFFTAHKCNKFCAQLQLQSREASSPKSPLDSVFK